MNSALKLSLALCLLLVFGIPRGRAQFGDPNTVELRNMTMPDGIETVWSIPRARMDKLPKWTPDKPLPLSIAKAAELALAWSKARHPKLDNLEIDSIEIDAVTDAGGPRDHWFFYVEMGAILEGRPIYGADYGAVVLMDGTIVEPKTSKANLP